MSNRLQQVILVAALLLPASAVAADLETTVENVVHLHMEEKSIPGLSVAIVQNGEIVFSRGYGTASLEFNVPASPGTVYPISSVSKILAGLLAIRLAELGKLDLDAPISEFFADTPSDKRAITVRHLLQHTHGLEDFYRSDKYELDTGKSPKDSAAEEIAAWSLNRPAQFEPGAEWQYSLTGYVLLARILELAGRGDYVALVEDHVLKPTGVAGRFGGSETLLPGRNPVLYELVDDKVDAHIVEFPRITYAAGGFNTSVLELSKLFIALSGEDFVDRKMKQELWSRPTLGDGELAHYGLGWFSYRTSQDRWVVGHEGGGASWVIYYPDLDLGVIALSNMSGARADSLPYEIAREALAEELLGSD